MLGAVQKQASEALAARTSDSLSQLYEQYYGPVFLGTTLGGIFYGTFMICAYLYLNYYTREPWLNKGVIGILLILNTFDMTIDILRYYMISVRHPGDLTYFVLLAAHPLEWLTILSSAMTSMICQAFMAYRVVAFARAMRSTYNPFFRKAVTVLPYIMLLAWLNCVASGFGVPFMISEKNNYIQLQLSNKVEIWQPASYLSMDSLITIMLCLEVGLAKTGFGGSNAVLNALVSVVLRNGFLVVGLQAAQVATTNTWTTWSLFCVPIIGKIHSITLVALLTQPRIAQARYFAKHSQDHGSDDIAVQPHVASNGSDPLRTPRIIDHGHLQTPTLGVSGATSGQCPACGTHSPGAVSLNGMATPKDLSVAMLRRDDEGGRGNGISFRAALEGLLEDDRSEKSVMDSRSLGDHEEPPRSPQARDLDPEKIHL